MIDLADKEYVRGLAERRMWVKNGREVPIVGMSSDHIRNCILYLGRNDVAAKDLLVSMFESELDNRGCKRIADGSIEAKYGLLCSVARDLFVFYKSKRGPQYAKPYEEMLMELGVDIR